jgi:hypothetical protein
VTVRRVDPTTVPDVADTVVVPPFTVVARPVADTVATVALDEAQVTLFVKFCVLLLL